jgi:flagellar hook-length control protein FliK
MAQIDLLNLRKATSATSATGAGVNSTTKSTAAAGLFEKILSGQAGDAAVAVPGGNGLPSGNSLPANTMSMLQRAQSSQQLLVTLSPQQQSQIDDVSFITQLQPVVDMPQTPVATAVSQFTGSKAHFSDQQLQGLAVQLGVDPAVASLVLQRTVKPEAARSLDSLPLSDADVIKMRSSLGASTASVTTPQVATQSFLQQRQARVENQMLDKKTALANTINNVLTQTKAQVVSSTGSSAATSYASIMLAPSLVQKIDQLTGLTSTTTSTSNSLESQALGSYTGASFKAAAPLANVSAAAGYAPNVEISTMDLGQRFTSLMQGDSPAQLAARQMQDQVGQQLQRMVKEGRWQANLSLNPARLGQVSINLVMEDGVLQTQLLSGNAGVRELLESSLPRLKEQLESSGLQLADVSVGSDSRGQQQTRGEEPDWQLSQAVRNTNEDPVSMAAAHNRSGHDGDVDTFA